MVGLNSLNDFYGLKHTIIADKLAVTYNVLLGIGISMLFYGMKKWRWIECLLYCYCDVLLYTLVAALRCNVHAILFLELSD